ARSRKLAEENAAEKEAEYQELVKKNNNTAALAEKLINDANAEYARGLATLRSLESGRKLAIAQIKSDALSAAADAARKYLDGVRDAIGKVENFNRRVRKPPPVF